MALTINQVYLDLLSKLGIEDSTQATSLQQQDCVIAINSAMQALQTAGQDFFTRQRININVQAGTAMYAMATTVQNVLGPVRWNNSNPLHALGSRGELDQFDRLFLGSASYGAAAGSPIAYWVENIRQVSGGIANQINIWLAPVPNAAGSIAIEGVLDAPAYAVADLLTSAALPIPQNYTESIFLPLARIAVTLSSAFSRPELLERLTAEAQSAIERLAMNGGFPNVTAPQPEREVSA
jgi:hypothetical protein